MELLTKVLCVLAAVVFVGSLVSLVRRMQVNYLFEKNADAIQSARLVDVRHHKAGKTGLLPSVSGVYRSSAGDFASMNCYGRTEQVPSQVQILCQEGGILEKMDLSTWVSRILLPGWALMGLLLLMLLACL